MNNLFNQLMPNGQGNSQFSWLMKNGIDESKSCSVPYYLGSGFTTQEAWEIDNGDGTKTYYTFKINVSIPYPPHG